MIIILELVKYINLVRIETQHCFVTVVRIWSHYQPTSDYFLFYLIFLHISNSSKSHYLANYADLIHLVGFLNNWNLPINLLFNRFLQSTSALFMGVFFSKIRYIAR